jgi:hypothetical protein
MSGCPGLLRGRAAQGAGPAGRRAVLGLVLAGLLVLAGCANLPDSSAPQALGTIDRGPTTSGPPPLTAGRDPDLLVRDFLQASADPTNRHQNARQYLTPTAAAWDDAASTVVVEKPDTLRESRSGDSATYRVRARKIGELEANGAFHATDATLLDYKIGMTKVGNEWRIDDLPPGAVVEDTTFVKFYHGYPLYFPNAAGTTMVTDLRWVAVRRDQVAQQLLSMLAEGPQPALVPAVRNMLSGPVSLRGSVVKPNGDVQGVGVGLGGVQIDFAGASGLDQHGRELLAAQVVLTLSGADVLGPYLLLADSKPLDDRYAGAGWTVTDVASMNPSANARSKIGLHAVRDGSLVKVDTVRNEIEPTPGYFGSAHNLQWVALSQDGQLVAAVADSGRAAPEPPRTLVIGGYDGTAFPVAQGNSFTRPSWTSDGSSAWTVVDGERVIRAVHDRATGNVSVQDVDTSALFAAQPNPSVSTPHTPIAELRIDPTGTRAGLIAGGKAYVAVVVPQADGKYALTSPLPVAVSLSSTVVSLDWYSADKVMLALDGSVDPVQTVELDGFQPTPVTSQNLTTPVRVVSASPDIQYVADNRAVMQLQSAAPSNERFWREVYGLGANAIPVLPG